jgi:AMP deaminase
MLTLSSPGKSRSAFSPGSHSLYHPTESNSAQGLVSAGPTSQGPTSFHRTESLLREDEAARSHMAHPELPHEHKPMLEAEGLHGAGAGIGLGSGVGGFANADAHITAELGAIYSNIQKVLDLRHKYMRLSLQGPSDNPKDDPSWHIYPPHPEPVWDEGRERAGTMTNGGNTANDSMANSMVLSADRPYTRGSDHTRPISAAGSTLQNSPTPKALRQNRKPGQDIGSDFELSDLLPLPDADEMKFRLDENGVFQIYENSEADELDTPVINIPTIREFYMDLESILNISSDGPSKSFAFKRLQYLEGKFNLYVLLNEYQEMADSKRVPHRDFYNVRKVDTHVHHSACMNQKHLLRFIKSKMKKCPNEVVLYRDGKHLTLEEVFQSINLTAYDLSIDTLDMHACQYHYPALKLTNQFLLGSH